MGRDHSIECETCGLMRGGFNDLRCDCDDPHAAHLLNLMAFEAECAERLECLAANLAIGAALCRAHDIGWERAVAFVCGRPAPHEPTRARVK